MGFRETPLVARVGRAQLPRQPLDRHHSAPTPRGARSPAPAWGWSRAEAMLSTWAWLLAGRAGDGTTRRDGDSCRDRHLRRPRRTRRVTMMTRVTTLRALGERDPARVWRRAGVEPIAVGTGGAGPGAAVERSRPTWTRM